MTNKFLEITALITVGIEANSSGTFILGKWPKFCSKRPLNHNADIITTGTKLKNSMSFSDNVNFFSKKKGKTRDSHVANPQPKIVKMTKLIEGMFDHHSYPTTN